MYEESEIDELAPWLLIALTLVGGALRVLYLDKSGLWLDEAFSVWLSRHSLAEMLPWIVKFDQHPPLYYLLLHFWMALKGDGSYNVRLLSALFGAGTIPVIYLIGKRMSGTVVGLVAALLLAFSPFNIRFAQETRMYTLLAFNATVAIYALVRLLTDPRSARPIGSQFREALRAWRSPAPVEPDPDEVFSYKAEVRKQPGWRGWLARIRWLPLRAVETDLAWIGLILFSALTLLSHNTAVLFPIAVNLFVLGLMLFQRKKEPGSPSAFRAPSFWNWVIAQAAVFLLWSPWLVPFIKQASRVYQEFWLPAPTWETVIQALSSFINFATLRLPGLTEWVWVLYILVLCLGLWHYRKSMSKFLFLAALFAIPFLGELLVSLRRPIFYDKTLIWITVPLFLLLAAGIAKLKFRLPMILMLGIFATNNLFAAGDYYKFMYKEDWYTAAGYIANFAETDDLVLFNANWVQIPFDYYFRIYEEQYSIQVEKRGVPTDMFETGVLEPKMTAADIPWLVSLLSGHDRVFLVYSHNSYTDPGGLIPQTLASKMELTWVRDFYGGQVFLYETP